MKKLPEKDLWQGLKGRLSDYTEDPGDDSWDKIAGAIPQQANSLKGLLWIDRGVGLALLLLLAFNLDNGVRYGELTSRQEIHASFAEAANSSSTTSSMEILSSNTSAETSIRHNKLLEEGMCNETETTAKDISSSNENSMSRSNESSRVNDEISKEGNKSTSVRARNVLPGSKPKSKRVNQVFRKAASMPDNRTDASLTSAHDKQSTIQTLLTSAKKSTARQYSDAEIKHQDEKIDNITAKEGHEKEIIQENRNQLNSVLESVAKAENNNTEKAIVKHKVEEKPLPVSNSKSKLTITPVEKKKKLMHPQVYIVVTPSLSFYKITPIVKDEVIVSSLQSPGIFSKQRFGISLDAGLQRHITKHMEVYGGLSLYQQRQEITYEYVSDMAIDNSGDGFLLTPVTEAKSFNYAMLNIGASAGLFYQIMGHKLLHKIGLGLQYQKGMQSASGENSYANTHSNYFNYQILYRMEFVMTDKLNGYLQPSFVHNINASERLSEPFTIKQYRAGIGIGILYRF